ncbi:MAG: hypothetical protein HS114_33690 [Anaerolineales bacterium]|nr:hypothetical protein [Anaerolineales bacterium]
MDIDFELIGKITNIENIAVSSSIREITRLRKFYGGRRWRKLKGVALIRLDDGTVCKAEVHWYEAHVIGKRDMKIKQILDE